MFRGLAVGIGSALTTAIATTHYSNYYQKQQQMLYRNKCASGWQRLANENSTKYNKAALFTYIKDNPSKKTLLDYLDLNEADEHINFNTAMRFKKTLNQFPKSTEKTDLVIFLETRGGELGAVHMICDSMKQFKEKHKGNVYVVVNDYAFSGGTLIALSSDGIMMNSDAYLSKVDPQLMMIPLKHLVRPNKTSKNNNNSDTCSNNDSDKCSNKCSNNNGTSLVDKLVYGFVDDVFGTLRCMLDKYVKPHYSPLTFQNIVDEFIISDKIHSHMYNKDECKKLGLKIIDMPPEFLTT